MTLHTTTQAQLPSRGASDQHACVLGLCAHMNMWSDVSQKTTDTMVQYVGTSIGVAIGKKKVFTTQFAPNLPNWENKICSSITFFVASKNGLFMY